MEISPKVEGVCFCIQATSVSTGPEGCWRQTHTKELKMGDNEQRAPTQRLGIRTGLRRLQHQDLRVLQETNQVKR